MLLGLCSSVIAQDSNNPESFFSQFFNNINENMNKNLRIKPIEIKPETPIVCEEGETKPKPKFNPTLKVEEEGTGGAPCDFH